MVAKTAWQAVRVLTLLGGLLLLPATAMVGPGKGTPWAYWIWEGSLGVKLASAREPFDLEPAPERPLAFLVKNQFDPKNPLFPQNPSERIAPESTLPIHPLGDSSNWGNGIPLAISGGRDFPPLQSEKTEKRGSGLSGLLEAEATPPGNGQGPGVRDRTPEPSPVFRGNKCQTGSGQRGVSPSELFPWQKDCQQLGRYLEQLGATEYSVHPWAPSGGGYRAWCRVKVFPNGSLWTQHFEATGQTAPQAMAKVVAQVIQWRERNNNMDGTNSP